MTQDEYERSKKRLEEQRRAGVELVETAYQAQIRALDLVWMLQGGIGGGAFSAGSAAQEPLPPPPERPRRRSAHQVDDEIRENFWRLPETFTRSNVCEILGYEPNRGAIYRSLRELYREGTVQIEAIGEGKRATVYRKTGGDSSPAST